MNTPFIAEVNPASKPLCLDGEAIGAVLALVNAALGAGVLHKLRDKVEQPIVASHHWCEVFLTVLECLRPLHVIQCTTCW